MGMDAWLYVALSAEVKLEEVVERVIEVARQRGDLATDLIPRTRRLKLLEDYHEELTPMEIYEDDSGAIEILLAKCFETLNAGQAGAPVPAAAQTATAKGKAKKNKDLKRKSSRPSITFGLRKSSGTDEEVGREAYYLCLARYLNAI